MALKNRYSTLRQKHDNQRQSKQPSDGNAESKSPATASATNTKASCRSGNQDAEPESPWNQRIDLVRFEDDDEDDGDDDDEDNDEELVGAEDVYDDNEYYQEKTIVPVIGIGPPHTGDGLRKSQTNKKAKVAAEQFLDHRHTANSDTASGPMYFHTASESTNSMDLGGTRDMSCHFCSFGLSHTMSCTLDLPTALMTSDRQQDAESDSMIHSNYGEQTGGSPAST